MLVLRFLQRRHEANQWEAAGRQAGLNPVGDGSSDGALELTGSVNGRPVTARYETRREIQGNEGRHKSLSNKGSRHRVTYTIVEVELSGAADGGVIVSPASGGGGSAGGSGMLGIGDTTENASDAEGVFTVAEDGLMLMGTPQAAVEAVSEGLAGRALRAIRDLQIVTVGDASGVAARLTEGVDGRSMFGVGVGDVILKDIPKDETTVYVETMAFIRDGDELRQFAEGAVAVADAFEEATARTSAPE